MKKLFRNVVSIALVTSILAGVSSCSLFDKANKLCVEIGDEFIQAALDSEIEDMADLCADDDEALAAFNAYANLPEQITCILENSTFKATDKKCSTKDGKGTITYVITLPDWEVALDQDPDDVDEFVDLIEDMKDGKEKQEITVELSFKLKKDNWYIKDYEDFIDDFYAELLDIDFPFESSLTQYVDYTSWYQMYSGTTCLNMDVLTTGNSPTWRYYFEVYQGNTLIYTSDVRSDEPSRIESYCYLSDTALASMNCFPDGTYRFVLYDEGGAYICEDSHALS